jgi:SAM-dependent methyltransferase
VNLLAWDDPRMDPAEAYDRVADIYDKAFSSNVSKAEDVVIYSTLEVLLKKGFTLDLGCGTGSLLEHWKVEPENYIGIDLSPKMIDCAKKKFPEHYFNNLNMLTFTPLVAENTFENVISLFGSISYVDPLIYQEIYRILKPGGTFFLMLYNNRYLNRKSYIMNRKGFHVQFYTYAQIKRFLPPHQTFV